MAILDIIKAPNVLLNQTCKPVSFFDDEVRLLVKNMFDTVSVNKGIGLAAPQVGFLQRIFICFYDSLSLVFVNPVIECFGDRVIQEEGCLSIPDILLNVIRYSHVKVTAFDENGVEFTNTYDGMLAIIIQHENDHLNGILITDKAKNN